MKTAQDFRLKRNPFGSLELEVAGRSYTGVLPVRSFPISAPSEGIALMASNGAELIWISHLSDLPEDVRSVIDQELNTREFVPVIRRIRQVSSYATPSRWQVETDRGDTTLLLRAEEDIRRLSATSLLIADSHGVQFLIRDVAGLDKASRRMLDRFL